MTITPVGLNSVSSAAGGAGNAAQSSARMANDQVSVKFDPNSAVSSPLEQVGTSVVSQLKNFEASRADRNAAMTRIHAGPATAIENVKSELLAGPASQSLVSESSAKALGDAKADRAITAMTRTFDYAIETQLIVKTGSQLSTSASSLMRGQ